MKKYRMMLPIVMSISLTILLGMIFKVTYTRIFMLCLYSSLFELGLVLLSNKGFTIKLTSDQIYARMKNFLNQTKILQILMFSYIIFKLYSGMSSDILYFYTQVFLTFYVVGCIFCLSDIRLKERVRK